MVKDFTMVDDKVGYQNVYPFSDSNPEFIGMLHGKFLYFTTDGVRDTGVLANVTQNSTIFVNATTYYYRNGTIVSNETIFQIFNANNGTLPLNNSLTVNQSLVTKSLNITIWKKVPRSRIWMHDGSSTILVS